MITEGIATLFSSINEFCKSTFLSLFEAKEISSKAFYNQTTFKLHTTPLRFGYRMFIFFQFLSLTNDSTIKITLLNTLPLPTKCITSFSLIHQLPNAAGSSCSSPCRYTWPLWCSNSTNGPPSRQMNHLLPKPINPTVTLMAPS